MKFNDRKEYVYSPDLFRREDVGVALRIHSEFICRMSPRPPPKFFEVARDDADVDPLWHMPTSARTQYSRTLEIPAINAFQKPDWRLTKVGIVPQRRDQFWLSNLHLQEFDYFPIRGDMVFWNGYRYMVNNTVIPPENYWQQTGVWLGLYVECIIVPDGDARPTPDLSVAIPSESKPLPEP